MDMATISSLISIIGFIVVLWNLNRNNMKEVESKTEQFVKINMKLDTLCQSQTDIKDDIRGLKSSNSDIDKRLTELEFKVKAMEDDAK